MGRVAALLAVAAAALAGAPAGRADHAADPPWPTLLPALASSAGAQPHPVENCPAASIACVDDLAARLTEQWRELDARCDHLAPAALGYLRITERLRADLAAPQPGLVADREWMTYLITTFSNRWFAAVADFAAGRPVARAWAIAFRAAARGDVTAGQDVLLFSNAHVQHDLPFALEEMGLLDADGRSRKPDHDAVNVVNADILDPTQEEVAARYDPSMRLFDASPSPIDEHGVLEVVKLWRENAWRTAERLVAARTRAERRRVVASIERTSGAWARLIALGGPPGHRARRDAHCRSQPR